MEKFCKLVKLSSLPRSPHDRPRLVCRGENCKNIYFEFLSFLFFRCSLQQADGESPLTCKLWKIVKFDFILKNCYEKKIVGKFSGSAMEIKRKENC